MNTVLVESLPLLPVRVSAGFPSPAAAYAARPLVLDDWLWPSRSSCRLQPDGPGGARYHVLDQSLSPLPGDRVWWPCREALSAWPESPLPESLRTESLRLETGGAEACGDEPAGVGGREPGVVVTATIQLFRRRPDPGGLPDSIHAWLVRRPHATYLVRAQGRSMRDFGIEDGSLLVVDRGCSLHDGDIVIAGSSEGFLVKRYHTDPARLVAGNTAYPDILLARAPQYDLDGVVIASLTRHREVP